jgi:hypothetical protein
MTPVSRVLRGVTAHLNPNRLRTPLTPCRSILLVGLLIGAGPVAADAVTDWNEITMTAATQGRPGPLGQLDVALVQIAVHDAVQAIDKRFEPYHVDVRGAKGSRSAAVAAAAHDVLVGIYPAQSASIDAAYYNYLADKGLMGDPGLLAGQKVAAGILPLRRVAPDPLPPPFVGGTNPGEWRPTDSFIGTPAGPPAPFSPMYSPWMANLDPFTLTSPARFRAEPPPALTSERYRRDYEEVKALGAFSNSSRTPEQTDVAYFYSENFFTQWNRALRSISNRYIHRTGDRARLFALANMAAADAVIASWDSKKFYALWRPLTAIREGNNDGNPRTVGDAAWQPLVNNPNYPDYTSGANVVTAAILRTLAQFFGTDRVSFDVTSVAPLAVQKTRTYNRFSDAAQDVVDARVYLGIHFRFADTAARTQGERVAEWAFDHFLLPLDKHRGHHDGHANGHSDKDHAAE